MLVPLQLVILTQKDIESQTLQRLYIDLCCDSIWNRTLHSFCQHILFQSEAELSAS